jgi:hypothetical protein
MRTSRIVFAVLLFPALLCAEAKDIPRDEDGHRIVSESFVAHLPLRSKTGKDLTGEFIEVKIMTIRGVMPTKNMVAGKAIVTVPAQQGGPFTNTNPIKCEFPKGATLPADMKNLTVVRGVYQGNKPNPNFRKGQPTGWHLLTDCCWVEGRPKKEGKIQPPIIHDDPPKEK